MSAEPFRGAGRPTLGVELELQLPGAETVALRPAAAEVLAGIPAELRAAFKPEFHALG